MPLKFGVNKNINEKIKKKVFQNLKKYIFCESEFRQKIGSFYTQQRVTQKTRILTNASKNEKKIIQ